MKELFFDDDTFTDDRPRAEEIARGLGRLGLTWSCNAKANVPRETLKVLQDNGLRLLLVGYESGNQQILINIKKGLRVERARQFAADCRELGITVHGTFILGLPGETKETIQETIRFAREVNPHTIQVSIAAPYPGTELYRQAVENGWLPADDDGVTLVSEQGTQLGGPVVPASAAHRDPGVGRRVLPAVLFPGRETGRDVGRDVPTRRWRRGGCARAPSSFVSLAAGPGRPDCMRVLLVHPSALMYSEIFLRLEPLGLERVAAALLADGHEVKLVDLQVYRRPELERTVAEFRPQAVGFSLSYLANVPEVVDLAKWVKTVLPDALVFVGGHSVSFVADQVLGHAEGAIDVRAQGRGRDRCPGPARGGLPTGPWPRSRGRSPWTAPARRRRWCTASTIILPARHLGGRRRKYFIGVMDPAASIEFTRGCPWDCSFCSAWTFYGRSYRRRRPRPRWKTWPASPSPACSSSTTSPSSRPRRATRSPGSWRSAASASSTTWRPAATSCSATRRCSGGGDAWG